jgi:PIN domain nuclease of toxin-antitoxin system
MIVLDTSAWIRWAAEPARLSARARAAIEREEKAGGLVVSTISVWEVALKHSLGKLRLDRDVRSWLALAMAYPGVRLEPLDHEDALESTLLPGRIHRDPADRFVVALARRLEAPLVTSDRRLRRSRHVDTIW